MALINDQSFAIAVLFAPQVLGFTSRSGFRTNPPTRLLKGVTQSRRTSSAHRRHSLYPNMPAHEPFPTSGYARSIAKAILDAGGVDSDSDRYLLSYLQSISDNN